MRRTDREIKNLDEILLVLKNALICRVGLSDNNIPYIVPLNFGMVVEKPLTLYFHCASNGYKLDIIRKNKKACFEAEIDVKLLTGSRGCDWSMQYRSVIGFGNIDIVTSEEEKIKGMSKLMEHYAGPCEFIFDPVMLAKTTVLKLTVDEITGKEHLLR